MVAFNFQARFAQAVRDGTKRQTIRARGKRRPPAVGEPLQLFSGMRTQYCQRLRGAICKSVRPISISAGPKPTVQMLDERRKAWFLLEPEEIEELARADGFSNAAEMFDWIKANHGSTLWGYLVQWDFFEEK